MGLSVVASPRRGRACARACQSARDGAVRVKLHLAITSNIFALFIFIYILVASLLYFLFIYILAIVSVGCDI